MSDPSAHPHAHPQHGADHTPHVTPYKVYFATWGALVVLTALTVGASYVNFGPANLIIAIVIATIKASIVGALFMHLWHDNKMHSLILVSGGLFLMIFISFTMFDTEYRGRADAIEGERPADITRPFEGTKSLAAMKAKWPNAGTHGSASASAGAGETHGANPPGGNPPGANTAGASTVGSPDHDHPPIPGSSAGAPSPSGSTPPARIEPASNASAGASVTASPNSSVPAPPAASISPAPGGHK